MLMRHWSQLVHATKRESLCHAVGQSEPDGTSVSQGLDPDRLALLEKQAPAFVILDFRYVRPVCLLCCKQLGTTLSSLQAGKLPVAISAYQ